MSNSNFNLESLFQKSNWFVKKRKYNTEQKNKTQKIGYEATKHELVTDIALVNLILLGKNLRENLRTASCCITGATKYHNINLAPKPKQAV